MFVNAFRYEKCPNDTKLNAKLYFSNIIKYIIFRPNTESFCCKICFKHGLIQTLTHSDLCEPDQEPEILQDFVQFHQIWQHHLIYVQCSNMDRVCLPSSDHCSVPLMEPQHLNPLSNYRLRLITLSTSRNINRQSIY